MIFNGMGFGKDPATMPTTLPPRSMSAAGTMRMTMEALGLPLDDFTGSAEYAVATHRTEIAAGVIEAGTVAAIRSRIIGWRNGKEMFRRLTTYYATRDIDPAWQLHETGWHYLVEGDTPLEITITYPVSEEDWAAFTPRLTAHPPVNDVPYVCEAPPGFQTSADLPVIIANLSREVIRDDT